MLAATTQDYMVYGLGVMALIYLVVRPMLRKKKDPLDRPMNIGLSQQRAVERDMNNVLVELSQMARQITAQLDTRSAKLEALIEEADRKIEELKRAQREAAARGQAQRSVERSAERSADRSAERPAAVEKRAVAATVPPAVAVQKSTEETRHVEIYSLADRGHSPQDIATQLNRPRGEIELILALRSR